MTNEFDRDLLRTAGRRAVDLFVDNFDGAEHHRVSPTCTREDLREQFAGTISDSGVGLEQAVEDFAKLFLPNSMRTPHPLYLGLVNTSPLPGGTIGDFLISTLNNNGGAFRQGPAMAAAEEEVLATLARQFGIEGATGIFLPGGSYANLHGLLLARQRYFPEWRREGPTALKGSPVVYCSDAAHLSVARAARAMGLGDRDIVVLPSVGRGVLDVGALATRVQQDRSAGKRPFAVSATLGTTGTGALDPLRLVSEVCREHDLWLHVDACYGGGALLLEPPPPGAEGLDLADSLVVDPHKWFYMPMTAAIAFTRHAALVTETFDVTADYIPDDGYVDPYRRGIPTSRRCMGAVTWFGLRAHGLQTVRDAVRRNIRLTRLLEESLAERGFVVLPDGTLSIACARWEPAGWSSERIDELQMHIAEDVVRDGLAWFATVRHADNTWLRFNAVNLHTRERHILRLVQTLTETATRLTQRGQ